MPLKQRDHGVQSWATLSEGWPETREHAYAKYVYLSKSNLVPYGSYVLITDNKVAQLLVGARPRDAILRVESMALLRLLNENFSIVLQAIRETT
jgi:hypothetical protein